jgi:hypothetical protein
VSRSGMSHEAPYPQGEQHAECERQESGGKFYEHVYVCRDADDREQADA